MGSGSNVSTVGRSWADILLHVESQLGLTGKASAALHRVGISWAG